MPLRDFLPLVNKLNVNLSLKFTAVRKFTSYLPDVNLIYNLPILNYLRIITHRTLGMGVCDSSTADVAPSCVHARVSQPPAG
jgi:hypothetical protein